MDTRNGISFPSADAQQRLIEKVYEESDTDPLDVTYVEAHGTGTQAGDPIEISALSAVLTKGRNPDTPCYVGSVKSNIGHTESAAGVAGIIKASLSISKGAILPNIHFNKPNPNIDFAGGRITVPVKLTPWRESGKPRMASVNSFGYGGTNGHIILEEYIADQKAVTTSRESATVAHPPRCLIPLSAKSSNALKAVCRQLQDFLTGERGKFVDLSDLTYSLAYRRSALDERLALIVDNKSELVEKLAAITNGDLPEGSYQGSIDPEESLRMVFVFTGMGPQWWGMGRELYATEPVFKRKVDECDAIFTRLADWSIKAELLAPEERSQMATTCIAQPATFVIQVALLDLYRSWGIEPSAVVGHSVGEVASAYAAGALSLKDALMVSFHRSRLQQTVAGNGAMLAIGIGYENAKVLSDVYDRVSVAAVNSTTSVTLAGDPDHLAEIAHILDNQRVFNRMLQVEVAYHSYQMDPIETELRQALVSIRYLRL